MHILLRQAEETCAPTRGHDNQRAVWRAGVAAATSRSKAWTGTFIKNAQSTGDRSLKPARNSPTFAAARGMSVALPPSASPALRLATRCRFRAGSASAITPRDAAESTVGLVARLSARSPTHWAASCTCAGSPCVSNTGTLTFVLLGRGICPEGNHVRLPWSVHPPHCHGRPFLQAGKQSCSTFPQQLAMSCLLVCPCNRAS